MPVDHEYHSQWGQDRFIHQFLMPHTEGTFFEAGAHNGLHLSNTLFFERALDWRGILVEMQPWFFPAIAAARPRSKCVQAALGTHKMQQLFLNAGDRSGLLRHIEPANVAHLEAHYQSHDPKPKFEVVWVDVRPIMEVFDEAGMAHINYFSLDVEGAELEILRMIDFSRVTIDLFTIEANDANWAPFNDLLAPRGYAFIGSRGVDGFFVAEPVLADLAARLGPDHMMAMRYALTPPVRVDR